MKTPNGNMPAMPVIEESKSEQYNGATYTTATAVSFGLTKREQFAMAAMQGILSHGVDYSLYDDNDVVQAAVIHADNLLAELERTK